MIHREIPWLREALLQSTRDLHWLREGQTVLLKPALNSPDPYPSTTHPLAIGVVSKILAKHGAPGPFRDQDRTIRTRQAHVINPKPGLVFASADPVAAEAFGLALLKDLRSSVPYLPGLTERIFLYQNRNVRDLATLPVRGHLYIRHTIGIGIGTLPREVMYTGVPYAVQDRIKAHLHPP